MIKSILIVGLLTIPMVGASKIVSVEDNIKELKRFTPQQRAVMFASYRYGFNQDLGVSMAILGWQESKSGKDRVNLGDPSFGIYHNLLQSVLNREGVRNSLYYRNKFANKLMTDDNYARSQALEELLYWESYHLGKTGKAGLWQKTIRSYNAGGNWSGEEAKAYFINIKNKLEAVKRLKYFDHLKRSLSVLR